MTTIEREVQLEPITWLLHNCALALGTATCTEGSPAYLWNESLTIPNDAEYLSFDFRWDNRGNGDYLSVQFGNQLLFNFLGSEFDGTNFLNSGLIPIAQFDGITDQLLFALNSVGDGNAQFSIRNLRFVSADVPQPGTLVLIILGLAALASQRRQTRGFDGTARRMRIGRQHCIEGLTGCAAQLVVISA